MAIIYSNFDPPITAVRRIVALAIAEDLEPNADITSNLIEIDKQGRINLNSRQTGVLAGSLCFYETFNQIDSSIQVDFALKDGDHISKGQTVASIFGNYSRILTAERTALNFLSHLSGVATLTDAYCTAAKKGYENVKVLDTRKTTPGLRALEKAAVRAGGGVNHRGNLSEAVLIKDNHLGEITVIQAIERVRSQWPTRMIEVECDSLDQVETALKANVTVVMLDNMSYDDIVKAVEMVKSSSSNSLVEVSGGVSLDTIEKLASSRCDLISVGALTHSAPIVDFGFDLID